MPIKEIGTFTNSKIASHKVHSDKIWSGGVELGKFTKNTNKIGIGLASKTKAAVNPTSDGDENRRAPQMNGDESMTPSTKGGASGDGRTPGYNGSGSGIAELNGAHGR